MTRGAPGPPLSRSPRAGLKERLERAWLPCPVSPQVAGGARKFAAAASSISVAWPTTILDDGKYVQYQVLLQTVMRPQLCLAGLSRRRLARTNRAPR